jgi:predicted aspartyl protease
MPLTARLLLATLALFGLGGCSAGGPDSCKINRLVDLPLLSGARLPAMEATLDGRKVVFYVDTGASTSILTKTAVERFGLYGDADRRMLLRGIGGDVMAPIVKIHRLVLGNGLVRDIELPVAGDLGHDVQGIPVLGLFGADFLSNYDVNIDLPHHHFAMYDLHGCGTNLRPLDDPEFDVPFHLEETKVLLDVKLNGMPMTAVLDSGATGTLVTQDDARHAGVTSAAMTGDRYGHAMGIDENQVAMHLHRFGSLDIGSETMRNFPFAVGDVDYTLLGDDFLRFNEVWISYPLQRLFIHPVLRQPVAR